MIIPFRATTPDTIRRVEAIIAKAEKSIVPLGALLPAAWITGERLIVYLSIPGPAAVVMACAVEWLGLQIVSTKTALIGRGMPEQEKRMTWAFAEYLAIIVAVNGILAVSSLTGWVDWGKIVAELVLGLMALPVQGLVSVNKRIADIAQVAADAKADIARNHAEAVAERERTAELENIRVIELEKLRISEAASIRAEQAKERAEKRAVKTSLPKVSEHQPNPARSKKQNAMEFMSARFSASGALPKLSEIMAFSGVSQSSASEFRAEWKSKNA